MMCWLTRRRLGAYRDGELDSGTRAKTAAHLTRCAGCAAELQVLGRLHEALTVGAPEPPGAVWDAFWPQVRARMAVAPEASSPRPRRLWPIIVAHPRWAITSALALASLAAVAVMVPWQPVPEESQPLSVSIPATALEPSRLGALQGVVVQAVETADPQSTVMVFTHPESADTVVWVFGLERTEI